MTSNPNERTDGISKETEKEFYRKTLGTDAAVYEKPNERIAIQTNPLQEARDSLEKVFFEASWREKLNRWSSPAGVGHTLAHLELAFEEAIKNYETTLREILAVEVEKTGETGDSAKYHYVAIKEAANIIRTTYL